MAQAKKNALPKYFKPVFTALLAALIVLLTFTVGSLRIGPITITLNCLPVAIGAVLMGPLYGAILGLVFGLTSFLASFTSASLTTIPGHQSVLYVPDVRGSARHLRLGTGSSVQQAPQEQ